MLPDLDDEFAKDVGDYESFEDLKIKLKVNLQKTKEITSRGDLRQKLVEKLVDANEFDAPPSMVRHRQGVMVSNVERNMLNQGIPKEEIEKNRAKFVEDSAGPAERRVRATLILEQIADGEKIEVASDEINRELK